ncbi:MAG: DUF2798 domain-containing protein [Acidovorax sp.]|uniref:DUF2798 domain-containing protein n=1 Tax=Acidovorax sp. TaxID=1872122 RepID=UPI0025BB8512|nr:DUF2798 domain-containing protein [Acidovorax sp.]MCE1190548.1 DUF2798 domain-containing protein [Acidovorax sp.]
MIPARYGPVLFSLILSGVMSLLVSGISTLRTLPTDQSFPDLWARAWLTGWVVAFPAVMLAAPLARKLVARLTASECG